MEISGKIIVATEVRSGQSARTGNNWMAQDFVIETHEQYPRRCVFSVFGEDRLKEFNIKPGEELTVYFDIDAHEYNGRWFNNLREGVFACGNVLHVHDLVDFVSEEAKTAGRNAAEYVKNLQADTDDKDKHSGEEAAEIVLNPVEGVRYTVPSTINPVHMDENLTVRFRVGGVYKNCYVSVYFDEERVIHKKRPVVAPGEMEQIKLTKEQLMKYPGLKTITVKIEEA